MAFYSRRSRGSASLDEFLDGGAERAASPLDLALGAWQAKLAALTRTAPGPSDLRLTAFTLVRGGDLFVPPKGSKSRAPAEPSLLETYRRERLHLLTHRAGKTEQEAAVAGLLRVLAGNPAVCRRMLLAKPIDVVLVPARRDFSELGFPPTTNPRAAGVFWNTADLDHALLGLREELILEKPWLMVHEMMHAVHFLAFDKKEREAIDAMLMPVYRSRRWIEEVVAIYAERAFGAVYTEQELASPDLYGKTRREWTDQAVFAKFIEELLRPTKP